MTIKMQNLEGIIWAGGDLLPGMLDKQGIIYLHEKQLHAIDYEGHTARLCHIYADSIANLYGARRGCYAGFMFKEKVGLFEIDLVTGKKSFGMADTVSSFYSSYRFFPTGWAFRNSPQFIVHDGEQEKKKILINEQIEEWCATKSHIIIATGKTDEKQILAYDLETQKPTECGNYKVTGFQALENGFVILLDDGALIHTINGYKIAVSSPHIKSYTTGVVEWNVNNGKTYFWQSDLLRDGREIELPFVADIWCPYG